MINLPLGARVLLATRPVDFRKGAYGLAALASEVLGEDPFSGAVIVFRSKRSDRVKILVWDTSGVVLVWKQLQWVPLAADNGRGDAAVTGRICGTVRRSRLDAGADNKGDSETHCRCVGFVA